MPSAPTMTTCTKSRSSAASTPSWRKRPTSPSRRRCRAPADIPRAAPGCIPQERLGLSPIPQGLAPSRCGTRIFFVAFEAPVHHIAAEWRTGLGYSKGDGPASATLRHGLAGLPVSTSVCETGAAVGKIGGDLAAFVGERVREDGGQERLKRFTGRG